MGDWNPGRLCGLLLCWLVAGWLLFGVAAPASAHAELERSTPAADAVLATAPAAVELVFSEAVTLLPDSIRVFGPDGEQVDDRGVSRIGGNPATARVGLRPDLPEGTYVVSYRVVSDDSHPVAGEYSFSIGHPSRAVSEAGAAGGSRTVDLALGVSRWLTYAGSALGLGGFAFLAWCWPAGWRSRRARGLVTAGVAVLGLGTLLALVLKGPYDAGVGVDRVSDTRLLREVLATTYGRALDLRLLLIALVVLVLTYRHHLPVRWLGVCAGALLTGCGVTFALCGHAAAGGHREWAVASDTLHVVAMSVWLGGLAMLLAVVLAGGPQCGAQRPGAMQAVFRFSTLATGALTVMVATGTFQALREVRSWDVLLHTHYGHVLLVKLGVVGLALLAAAGSRTWVWRTAHPVVAVHASTGAPPEPAIDSAPSLRRLRTSVGLETLLLTGVLVVSALLVTSDPAASSPQAATSLTWSGQARPTT